MGGAAAFLDKHLMTLLVLAASAYSGYVTGQAGAKEMDARVTRLEQISAGRFKAWQCAVRTLDALKHKGAMPDCELDVPE